MKKLIFMALAVMGLAMMVSCDDDETYADQKERERDDINAYIVKE